MVGERFGLTVCCRWQKKSRIDVQKSFLQSRRRSVRAFGQGGDGWSWLGSFGFSLLEGTLYRALVTQQARLVRTSLFSLPPTLTDILPTHARGRTTTWFTREQILHQVASQSPQVPILRRTSSTSSISSRLFLGLLSQHHIMMVLMSFSGFLSGRWLHEYHSRRLFPLSKTLAYNVFVLPLSSIQFNPPDMAEWSITKVSATSELSCNCLSGFDYKSWDFVNKVEPPRFHWQVNRF